MNVDPDTDAARPDATRTRNALLAHLRRELSAPIDAIIDYSEMTLEGAAGDAAVRADLQKILTAGRQLRTRVDELLHPDRAAAHAADLDAFGAHVRHELRTPINAINGYSEMLIEDATEAGHTELVADLQQIHTSGQQLLALIDDIVRFSAVEVSHANFCPADAGVSSMIASVVSTLHALDDAAHSRDIQGADPRRGRPRNEPRRAATSACARRLRSGLRGGRRAGVGAAR